MKRLLVLMALASVGCGAGTVAVPIPIPIPIVPISASLVPLDGSWILADVTGARSCLVIQESRVSILDLACSNDGLGLVARIREAPVISRSGFTIVVTVSYFAKTGVENPSRLVFVGELQIDGTFVGTRRDETVDPPDDDIIIVEQPAVLSRT